jgi:hypothetical protein
MTKLTNRMEAIFTAALWLAATMLLPMAALAPVGIGRAEAHAFASASCMNLVVDTGRACRVSAF